MKVKRRTFEFLAFAGLLLFVGLILGLWFYTLAGFVVMLYVAARLFAFRSVVEQLDVNVTRHAVSSATGVDQAVTVGVDLESNVNVSGTFTDAIPDGFVLTGGANPCERTLTTGTPARIDYALRGSRIVHVAIPRSVFVAENDLFTHPLELPTDASWEERPTERLRTYSEAEAAEDAESWTMRDEELGAGRALLGAGFEFSGLRPYETTDAPTTVHWKASARLNRLVSKQFYNELGESVLEAGAPVTIVVDQSGGIGGTAGQTALEFATTVARYFIQRAADAENRVSVVTYDARDVTSVAANAPAQRAFDAITSLDEARSAPVTLRPLVRKPGMTQRETKRLEALLAAAPPPDDDGKQFREILRHVYAHEEGYEQDLRSSPAFRAISDAVAPSLEHSTLFFISDVENDVDPVIEGIQLAAYSGAHVYVVTMFSPLFERYDDPFVATEALYAAYARYKRQVNKIASIPGITMIEALSPEHFGSALSGTHAGVTAWGGGR